MSTYDMVSSFVAGREGLLVETSGRHLNIPEGSPNPFKVDLRMAAGSAGLCSRAYFEVKTL